MNTQHWITIVATLLAASPAALAQGTAFTYQGRFQTNGVPYSGTAEFQFTLWDTATDGGPLATNNPVAVIASVAGGLFTVTLDFGLNPFNGQPRFLQTDARTAIGPFTTLLPRQPLTPTPYAITAGNVTSNGLSGVYGNALTFNNAANSFTGNGGGLTSLNASRLTAGTVPNARIPAIVARTNEVWLLGGNVGAGPADNFIGTVDNQPLEIRVNGRRALRVEWTGDSVEDFQTEDDGSVNLIGGAPTNSIALGNVGSVISGGGAAKLVLNPFGTPITNTAPNQIFGDYNAIAGGAGNTTSNSFSTVLGGSFNIASGRGSVVAGGSGNESLATESFIGAGSLNVIEADADSSAIAAGEGNQIWRRSVHSAIGGGLQNYILTNVSYSTIGGGRDNFIRSRTSESTIGGGAANTIDLGGNGSTISGGVVNRIETNVSFGMIPGGWGNVVAGNGSFAAGFQARALHNNTFVWAGGNGAAYRSTLAESFNVFADGGASFDYGGQRADGRGNRWVYIGAANAGNTITTWNGARLSDGGVWSNASDKNRKSDFKEADVREVLERLVALPVSQWRYTNECLGVKHLGPTAQDFRAAFGLGTDDKTIGTVDADGVALAAIQGLNQKVEMRSERAEGRIQRLELENSELKARLAKLEQLIQRLDARGD